MKYITILDIAKEVGVSKSTVSRALAGDSRNVKPETMRKIQETALKMGYRRNELAVNLRCSMTKNIGIVIPEGITPFFMSFIQQAQKEMRDKGFRTIIAVSNEDSEQERENLTMLENCRIDGIMICPCHKSRNIQTYKNIIENGIPLVFFDRKIEGIDVSQVCINDNLMSHFMVEYLIRNGKKNIVHISGPDAVSNAVDRYRGYREALEKFHIPYDKRYVIDGGLTAEEGANAMEQFLSSGLEFDAVFGFTETTILGAKSVLQKLNYRIPGDIALCCISGTKLCTLVYPTITAVEQPVNLMASESCRILQHHIETHDFTPEKITLRGNMILREST
ncbi:MAG: LacI family transcriptional regulator [Bacteroides sp.]|nr:LacI family transcriptional regulator [Bacteroides sp.]